MLLLRSLTAPALLLSARPRVYTGQPVLQPSKYFSPTAKGIEVLDGLEPQDRLVLFMTSKDIFDTVRFRSIICSHDQNAFILPQYRPDLNGQVQDVPVTQEEMSRQAAG